MPSQHDAMHAICARGPHGKHPVQEFRIRIASACTHANTDNRQALEWMHDSRCAVDMTQTFTQQPRYRTLELKLHLCVYWPITGTDSLDMHTVDKISHLELKLHLVFCQYARFWAHDAGIADDTVDVTWQGVAKAPDVFQ